jgi:hypothetical protein
MRLRPFDVVCDAFIAVCVASLCVGPPAPHLIRWALSFAVAFAVCVAGDVAIHRP